MKRFFVMCFLVCLAGMLFARGSSEGATSVSPGAPAEFSATFIKGSYHSDPDGMPIFTQLEKDANVKVNWMVIPDANWNERKNILINSGDMPDVFYMRTFSATEVDLYGRQGVFLDLTDSLKQYAPNVQRVMAENPIYKPYITNPEDGKIYNVKQYVGRAANNIDGQMFIYQPWLDKLGLKMPTTYLEFENMLRAFKSQDPNGNGRADEYPFVFANGWSNNASLRQFFAMFGYGYHGTTPSASAFIQTSDGKAVFVPGTENFREAIIWLHKLFAEGLLEEEDYAAMDNRLFLAKMFSDVPVAGGFTAAQKTAAYAPENRYNDYTQITTPLKGPHGHQIYTQNHNVLGTTAANFIVSNKGQNKMPGIMRWLDAQFARSIEMALGPIGVTLEQKAGGMLGYKPTPAGTTYNQFRYGNAPVDGPFFIRPEEWGTKIELMEEDVTRAPWVMGELKPYLTQWGIYSYPIASETQFIQSRGLEIENYIKTTQARWLMQGGIESEWDAFQARLKTMGVDDYIKVMQGQVDRFLNNAK
ncbi:MAG: extracellular solute-binding protein [Treponema sp.]|nr:extracellular solute-binding protein [Treponema sp.]